MLACANGDAIPSARSSTRWSSTVPTGGATSVGVGAAAGSLPVAFNTRADSGGTVTRTSPSTRVGPSPAAGHTVRNADAATGTSTVAAVSPAFATTTCSVCSAAAARLNATTSPSAYRSTWFPSRHTGSLSTNSASDASCRYSGESVRKLSCAPVRSLPTRSSAAYSGVGANMSCRVSASPPVPTKPCSSP